LTLADSEPTMPVSPALFTPSGLVGVSTGSFSIRRQEDFRSRENHRDPESAAEVRHHRRSPTSRALRKSLETSQPAANPANANDGVVYRRQCQVIDLGAQSAKRRRIVQRFQPRSFLRDFIGRFADLFRRCPYGRVRRDRAPSDHAPMWPGDLWAWSMRSCAIGLISALALRS
jgi:hypothetical protein